MATRPVAHRCKARTVEAMPLNTLHRPPADTVANPVTFESVKASAVPSRELGARGSRTSAQDTGLSAAAAAVLAGVPGWWRTRATDAGLSGRWTVLDQAVTLTTVSWPDVEPRDLTGLTAEDVAHAYVTSLDASVRSRHGRHYTPKRLASYLWEMAKDAAGLRKRPAPLAQLVRDPACGAGVLLLPVLRDHLAGSAGQQPELVLRGLVNVIDGSDLDEHAVWLANVLLAAECLPVLAAVPEHRREPLPSLATVADGLADPFRPAGIVVMNPPYGRVKLAPTERDRFTNLVHGHANLYGLFMGHHANHLTTGGVLAALVPTSFTSGAYFTNLRKHLAEVSPMREVAFVSDRSGIFSDVLQETCLATFTRNPGRTLTVSHINGAKTRMATTPPMPTDRPWLMARTPADAEAAATAAALPLTLAAAGWKASTGPLVWNRRKNDLHARPGKNRVRVIWGGDIGKGSLAQDPCRDDMRYLTLSQASDDRVMTLTGPAILAQRTTAPEQNRRLVTAPLTATALKAAGGSVVVENHVNVLRPTGEAPLLSLRLMGRLLASPHLDRVLRCLSGSVAVSAFELEALPLPDAATLRSWEGLTVKELRAELDRVYGVPQ